MTFTLFLLAQAGVPFTSGFLAKFYVIGAAVQSRSYALAIIGMMAAVVATFFYLRVIVVMYMGGETDADADATPKSRAAVPFGAALALGLCLLFTVGVGFFPQYFIDFARHATVLRL